MNDDHQFVLLIGKLERIAAALEEIARRMPPIRVGEEPIRRQCVHCSAWFDVGPGTGRRRDATFCSNAHRERHNSLKRSKSALKNPEFRDIEPG